MISPLRWFIGIGLVCFLLAFSISGCVTGSEKATAPTKSATSSEDRSILIVDKMRQEAVSRRVGRWAVIVGISDYKYDQRWDRRKGIPDLQYAHKDAEAFARFLMSPAGGAFEQGKVRLLTNQQATVKEVRMAVGDFLAQSLEDDLAIFFFAGHGTPDPKNPKNLYLLCHDTQPGKYYGTAFPMWEINTAIDRTIGSDRIIVLADACHSAGVGGTRGGSMADQFNTYMAQLAQSKPGVSKITASRADELSQERRFPEGGHGLFTYYLLDGLKGNADYNHDGFVTLKEAYEYLYDKVRSESRRSQNPWASTYVSDDIPLGVVDRQVLAAIEARAAEQQKHADTLAAMVTPAPPTIEMPTDSGVALKLAAVKLAKDEPDVAHEMVDAVIRRNDTAKPDALALKIRLLLKEGDLKGAEDTEDLLVIPYADHPAARKGSEAVYQYYLVQVSDATPKAQMTQLETYLRRHPNGLLLSEVQSKLKATRIGIKGRYERSFTEQLTLAKGFMEQNRFMRSQEALQKAENIADEALREYGVRLDRQAVENLRAQVKTQQIQYNQKQAFQAAKDKAAKELPEEQIQTWQRFIAGHPGSLHMTEAQQTLRKLRASIAELLQTRFDRLLVAATVALNSRDFARSLEHLDAATAINRKAKGQFGITLNLGDLTAIRSRNQTEAETHRDFLTWQNASSEAKAIALTDTNGYDRRIAIFKDFMAKWPDNRFIKNAQSAREETQNAKTDFMARKFNALFGQAKERFVAKDYSGAYVALEGAKKYATTIQLTEIDALARRYNAPPQVSIELENDSVNWETPIRFRFRAMDPEGDPVRVKGWDFGDGDRSGEESPVHAFAKWGAADKSRRYTISLEATDGHSTVTTQKTITVKRQDCVERDGRYCKYVNGLVYDTQTGLEWIAGPDRDTYWDAARSWVESLSVAGGGWRMPTRKELKSLYQKGVGSRNMTPLLRTGGWWVWSGETKASSYAWRFRFRGDNDVSSPRHLSYYGRGFAVRSR